MDFNTQDDENLSSTYNVDVAKNENMVAVSLEVVNTPLPISNMLQDTDDLKPCYTSWIKQCQMKTKVITLQ